MAEAEGDDPRRPQGEGVGAAAPRRAEDDRRGAVDVVKDSLYVGGGRQGHVDGEHEEPGDSLRT